MDSSAPDGISTDEEIEQQQISPEQIEAEMDQIYQELLSDTHLAGCVSRISNRIQLLLVATFNGKNPIHNIQDELLCTQILPLVVHILFRRTTFPASFSATHCNVFFQQCIVFSIQMIHAVKDNDSLFDIGQLLVGGTNVKLPVYLSTRLQSAAATTTTTTTAAATTTTNSTNSTNSTNTTIYINNVNNNISFYNLQCPICIKIGLDTIQYFPNDLTPVHEIASLYIGRDVKKRFRRYLSNGTGGWFNGSITSYDINTNKFHILFEDGDQGDYNISNENIDVQVCTMRMKHDTTGVLEYNQKDVGKYLQLYGTRNIDKWCTCLIKEYNTDGTHELRYISDGIHVLENMKYNAIQYRLLTKLQPLQNEKNQDDDGDNRDTNNCNLGNIKKSSPRKKKKNKWIRNILELDLISSASVSLFLLNNIQIFGDAGGFDIYFLKLNTLPMLYKHTNSILSTMNTTSIFISTKKLIPIIDTLTNVILSLLEKMNENDLRKYDTTWLKSFVINPLHLLLTKVDARKERKGKKINTAKETIEKLNVTLINKRLRSSYLDVRLVGMNEMENLLVKVMNSQTDVSNFSTLSTSCISNITVPNAPSTAAIAGINMPPLPPLPPPPSLTTLSTSSSTSLWMTSEWCKEWILKECIIEEIFGSRIDMRIIQRSKILLRFMANHNIIVLSHLDAVWKACSSGCHESTRRAIYDVLLSSVIPYVHVKLRLYMFQKIASTSYSKFDDQYFNLLQQFTLVSKEADSKCTSREELEVLALHAKTSAYGIHLLWTYLQDTPTSRSHHQNKMKMKRKTKSDISDISDIRPHTASALKTRKTDILAPPKHEHDFDRAKQALIVLTSLLVHPLCSEHRPTMLFKCLTCLEEGISIVASLTLIQHLVQAYPKRNRKNSNSNKVEPEKKNSTVVPATRRNSWFTKSKSKVDQVLQRQQQQQRHQEIKETQETQETKKLLESCNSSVLSSISSLETKTREHILDQLNTDDRLIHLFFDELQVYCSRVASSMRNIAIQKTEKKTTKKTEKKKTEKKTKTTFEQLRSPSLLPTQEPMSSPSSSPAYGTEEYADTFRLSTSCWPHHEQINIRLKFLQFVMNESEHKLKIEHVDILWNNLVTLAVSRGSRNIAYQWFSNVLPPLFPASTTPNTSDASFTVTDVLLFCGISNSDQQETAISSSSSSSSSSSILSLTSMYSILVKHLPTIHLSTLTYVGWEMFVRYFLIVNASSIPIVQNEHENKNKSHSRSFYLNKNNSTTPILVRCAPTVLGIQELWSIALGAANEKVGQEALHLLKLIHTSISIDSNEDLLEKMQKKKKITSKKRIKKNGASDGAASNDSVANVVGMRERIRSSFIHNCLKHVLHSFNCTKNGDRKQGNIKDADANEMNPQKDIEKKKKTRKKDREKRCVVRGVRLLSEFLMDASRAVNAGTKRNSGSNDTSSGGSNDTSSSSSSSNHVTDNSKKNNNQRNDSNNNNQDSIGGTVGTGNEEYNTNETYSKCINLKIRMKEVHHEYMDLLTSTTSTSTISSTMTEDYVEHLFQLFDHFDENQNDTDENDENDENNEIKGDVLNIMRCLPLHSTMAHEIKFLRLSASEPNNDHNIGNDPLESERFIRVLLKRTGSTCRLLYSLQLLNAYVTSSLSVSFDTNTTTNRTTTHTTTCSTQNNYQWNNNLINSKIVQQLEHLFHETVEELHGSNALHDPSLNHMFAATTTPTSTLTLSMLFIVTTNILQGNKSYIETSKKNINNINNERDNQIRYDRDMILSTIDVETMVQHIIDIVYHVVDGRNSGASTAATAPTAATAATASTNKKILLCVDSGMFLFIDLILYSMSTNDSNVSKYIVSLERLMDVTLVQCSVPTIRQVAFKNIQTLINNNTILNSKILQILFGDRFFKKVFQCRKNVTLKKEVKDGDEEDKDNNEEGDSNERTVVRNVQTSTEYFGKCSLFIGNYF